MQITSSCIRERRLPAHSQEPPPVLLSWSPFVSFSRVWCPRPTAHRPRQAGTVPEHVTCCLFPDVPFSPGGELQAQELSGVQSRVWALTLFSLCAHSQELATGSSFRGESSSPAECEAQAFQRLNIRPQSPRAEACSLHSDSWSLPSPRGAGLRGCCSGSEGRKLPGSPHRPFPGKGTLAHAGLVVVRSCNCSPTHMLTAARPSPLAPGLFKGRS